MSEGVVLVRVEDAAIVYANSRFEAMSGAVRDLGILNVSGDRVALELRERDPALATVLVTGWVLKDDDERLPAFELHLRKPSRVPDLEEAAEALELHDLRSSQPKPPPRSS